METIFDGLEFDQDIFINFPRCKNTWCDSKGGVEVGCLLTAFWRALGFKAERVISTVSFGSVYTAYPNIIDFMKDGTTTPLKVMLEETNNLWDTLVGRFDQDLKLSSGIVWKLSSLSCPINDILSLYDAGEDAIAFDLLLMLIEKLPKKVKVVKEQLVHA